MPITQLPPTPNVGTSIPMSLWKWLIEMGTRIRQLVSYANATIDSSWNGNHLTLGVYHLWVDSSGRLRVKSSTPTSDTDGVVVGTQS